MEICPNCKEKDDPCACLRNICIDCGGPVGNITFTVCDDCWDKRTAKTNKSSHLTRKRRAGELYH